jgi:phage minor structural protein
MVDLYKHDNTNFTANGDITLIPSNCNGKIELNGECTVTLEHPFDEEGRWEYIISDNVIACPTPWSDKQLFRIYNVVKTITGVTAYARHIFFDLVDYVLLDVRPTSKTGQQALDIILANTPFTGHSNIPTLSTAYYVRKNIVEALASDDENSFVSLWGGERYYDNYNLTINSRVGGDYEVRAEFGYNLTEIEEDINLDEVVTRIIPVGANELMLDGPTPYVDSQNINKYANIKTKVIKFDDVKVKENAEDTEGFATIEEARTELINRCNKLFTDGLDKPVVNYKVGMAYLRDTTAYKEYEVLEDVGIGDTVHCNHSGLDVEVSARCISLEWEVDFITDKTRITSLELGNAKADYFDKQSDISNRVEKILNNNGSVNGLSIEGVINALQTKFKAMKDIAQTQHIRAMLFEDLDNTSPTYGAMCIGTMGFEIASTRTADNKDWDWRTFGTGKGFTADEIVTGVLKAIVLESVDGSCRIDLGNGIIDVAKGIIRGLSSSWDLDEGIFQTTGTWNNYPCNIEIGGGKLHSDGIFRINNTPPIGSESSILMSYGSSKSGINLASDEVGILAQNGVITLSGETIVYGNFSVQNGTKNRIVETSQGLVKLNAFETPNALFADYATQDYAINETGQCIIKLDPLFLETVSLNMGYQVFLTKYSKGDVWVQERNLDSFLVCGEPETKFTWNIVAKQKSYENTRLDKFNSQ